MCMEARSHPYALIFKDTANGKKCRKFGGFVCLELYLYGTRELEPARSEPLIGLLEAV